MYVLEFFFNSFAFIFFPEPIKFFCGTCRKRYDSAWSLVQHAQRSHGMRIYFDASSQASVNPTAAAAAAAALTTDTQRQLAAAARGNLAGVPPTTGLPGLDPHFGGLLRMPIGEQRPTFPGPAAAAAAAAAVSGAPSFPRPSHDFRVDQLMGQHFPFGGAERPPLFGAAAAAAAAGLNIPASIASSTSANSVMNLAGANSVMSLAGLAGMDPQSLDFYSQRLKQLAGSGVETHHQTVDHKRNGGNVSPASPPMTAFNGQGPLTPRSHSSTPRPKSPTDSIRSDKISPPSEKGDRHHHTNSNNKDHLEPDSSMRNGLISGSEGDKHSSGSVDEDLLDEAMEEDEADEAEDLTTKSVSTPHSTPASTPVPSSSSAEKLQPGVPQPSALMSGSMIGDLMSKFGFSDIQEYQEAYKKALAESGAARAANNNNNILERSKTPQENGSHHGGLLRLRDDITKPHAPMVNSLDLASANPFLAGLAGSHFDPAKRLKLEREAAGSNLFAGLWMPGHHSPNR